MPPAPVAPAPAPAAAPAPSGAPLTLTQIGAGNYQVAKPVSVTAGSNDNPFNIKVGSDTQQYITNGQASVGSAATDGGYFLKFKDRDTAVQAAQQLLFDSGVYKGLTVDAALKKWSNGAYGGDLVPSLATTSIDDLTPDQQTQVLNAMETKGENDAPAPGTLTLSGIGAGNYQVTGKAPQTPVNQGGGQNTPVSTPPAWAPGGVPKPAAPAVGTKAPFSTGLDTVDPTEQKSEALAKGVGSFLTGAEQGLGKEAAAAIGAPAATANEEQISNTQNKNIQLAIAKIKELKAQGKDTSSAEAVVEAMLANPDNGASASDVLPAVNDTPADVLENAGGVALDVASFGTYGGGAKTGELALKGAPSAVEAAGKGVEALGQRSERKAVAQIAQDVAPKLTANETADAIAKQGTKKVGLLRRTVLNASKQANDIAATVRKMVPDFKPGGSLTANIEATRAAVSDSVTKLAADVEKSGKNIAVPIREVTSKIDAAEATPEIKIAMKDNPYANKVAALKEEAVNIMKKNGGTPSGLLKSTQDFDGLVRKVFPNLYDKEFSDTRAAVKVIRDAMNDTVDEALPDTAYKATRQAQSRLLSAIDNMSERAASGAEKEIGTTAVGRTVDAFKNHPVLGSLLGGAAGMGVYQEAKKVPILGSLLP